MTSLVTDSTLDKNSTDTNSTEMTETAELDATRPLTAMDRCDSCGAQAYVRAVMPSGELLFCAHHAAKHRDKLMPLVTVWHDETDRLLEAR